MFNSLTTYQNKPQGIIPFPVVPCPFFLCTFDQPALQPSGIDHPQTAPRMQHDPHETRLLPPQQIVRTFIHAPPMLLQRLLARARRVRAVRRRRRVVAIRHPADPTAGARPVAEIPVRVRRVPHRAPLLHQRRPRPLHVVLVQPHAFAVQPHAHGQVDNDGEEDAADDANGDPDVRPRAHPAAFRRARARRRGRGHARHRVRLGLGGRQRPRGAHHDRHRDGGAAGRAAADIVLHHGRDAVPVAALQGVGVGHLRGLLGQGVLRGVRGGHERLRPRQRREVEDVHAGRVARQRLPDVPAHHDHLAVPRGARVAGAGRGDRLARGQVDGEPGEAREGEDPHVAELRLRARRLQVLPAVHVDVDARAVGRHRRDRARVHAHRRRGARDGLLVPRRGRDVVDVDDVQLREGRARAAGQADEDPLGTEVGYVDQDAVRALGETGRVLQAAAGDVFK